MMGFGKGGSPPMGNPPNSNGFGGRPPPGKFFGNQVCDMRVPRGENAPPVTADEWVVFLHMCFAEEAMDDNFVDHVRKGKLVPVWVRSSGDRWKDRERSKAMGENMSLAMSNVAYEQAVKSLSAGWKWKMMAAYAEDLSVKKALQFDIGKGDSPASPEGAQGLPTEKGEMTQLLITMTSMMA